MSPSRVGRRRRHQKTGGWGSWVIVIAISLACCHGQDISACCDKAVGTCRSVCEKMSLMEIASSSTMRGERLHNIHKFCAPTLIEFWICMNKTIQEVVSGSEWWGRACCSLGRSAPCRATCAIAKDVRTVIPMCRRSDEVAFFDCVQRQQEAQWCCSQTQSLSCHEACQKALWRVGLSHQDSSAKEKAVELCEQSPPLLQCLRDLTASSVHTDTAKYLPCCQESPSHECRSTCEAVLGRTGESQEIAEGLAQACGAPAIHDGLWQCFLRKDAPQDSKDVIPHDAAKLHCCLKATTINCRRTCFDTFNSGWQNNWQKFYAECLGDPQETVLAECIEEVEAPCNLGCGGLTFCSQYNNRHTTLFRSCTAQADLDAHLAVAEQKDSGFVRVAGLVLPLRNGSQCSTEMWKNVACALHVKPCTDKGHSSALCPEQCARAASSCVQWARAAPPLSARALCPPRAAPCLSIAPNKQEPPLLSAREAITSPCAGSPCNSSQLCQVNRDCAVGNSCAKYTCIDGCPLGGGSSYVIPLEWWARVPMASGGGKACFKLCRCGPRGLTGCQPLPCVVVDRCRLQDQLLPHGSKFYMECNPCACYAGERVCGRRACARGSPAAAASALLTRLPCNCPPHHVPVRARGRLLPNACLAKCAGATDAEIEFDLRDPCVTARCPRRLSCLPAPTVCLSRLQTSCPQHMCVNTSSCNSQPANPVCDTDGRTHANPCHLITSGKRLAYWGQCLARCSSVGAVCGVNGVTYISECAAWSEYVSVDYIGPCLAVGPISDLMEPKCQLDRIICPPLKKPQCLGFTAPGACCPKCGGALRILYSKKQIDRALYGTNISSSVINLKNILIALERYVKIAECALKGYLTIESEIFVTVESILKDPTDLQLSVCVLEAEKLEDLINRESALISIDLGLSSLSYALIVHTYPSKGATGPTISLTIVMLYISIYLIK